MHVCLLPRRKRPLSANVAMSQKGHKRKTVSVDQLHLDNNRNPPNDSMETTMSAIDLIESRQRDSALEPTHGSAEDASSLSAGTKLHRGDTS
jgi:hypothetical protein